MLPLLASTTIGNYCRYAVSHYIYCYAQHRPAECHYAECHYAEWQYAECRYAECCGAPFILADIRLGCKGLLCTNTRAFFCCCYFPSDKL